ncbi:hypothetical protein [Halobacillus sp. Marseille-P3879]|uniref:hypothetical protein n=1 Tax=Halobacillus sp. Marseille-P3879 TaxID=2045014 RepID=UPI000C7E04BE|nr:hypothetical protein [Halobacillus sp. Marseille-P3879]
MNTTYRTNFLLRTLIPIFLFVSYFFISHSTTTLVAAILATLLVVSSGIEIHKNNKWSKTNLKHDQRTRANAHFAGYITYWMMLIALFAGGILLLNTDIPLTFPKLIGYTILGSFAVRWLIRDYLNNREKFE